LREGVALARSNGIEDDAVVEYLHGLLSKDAEARS
jgi:hypothetical protein